MRFRARMMWHLGGFVLLWGPILFGLWHSVPARAAFLVAALVLAAAGWSARAVVHKLARPIESLADASRRFGAGDLSTRVRFAWRHYRGPRRRGVDEISVLVDAWNDMAERIERLVGGQRELLANVSHELRSPLARMRVALELLPHTAETEARIAAVASDIAELDRLIDDVLTASRLDAAPQLRRRELAVADLLAGVRERAAHDPLSAGLEVRVAASAAPDVLSADEGLLRRALWNLVENAAKYGAPPISLAAEQQDGVLRLSVSDEGPGIPPEERERLLEAFQRHDRARTPDERRGGVGLGLTIARRVAELHGGRLELGPAAGDRGLHAALVIPLTPP